MNSNRIGTVTEQRKEKAMSEEVIGGLSGTERFDREELAKLGRIALRGRKISDVMEESGLSRSTISKLLNGKMKAPPSVDTLRKLAGDENPQLFRRMLEVCGHSSEWQDGLRAFHAVVQQTDGLPEGQQARRQWSSAEAMGTLIDALEEKKYGAQFRIDYRAEGCFCALADESDLRIIGVPVVINDDNCDARSVVSVAIKGITKGIVNWGLTDVVVLVLTNSPAAFNMLKEMPNLSKRMAVLLAAKDGKGFWEQAVVEAIEKEGDADEEFPFDLKTVK